MCFLLLKGLLKYRAQVDHVDIPFSLQKRLSSVRQCDCYFVGDLYPLFSTHFPIFHMLRSQLAEKRRNQLSMI